jgi:hypothetical protein
MIQITIDEIKKEPQKIKLLRLDKNIEIGNYCLECMLKSKENKFGIIKDNKFYKLKFIENEIMKEMYLFKDFKLRKIKIEIDKIDLDKDLFIYFDNKNKEIEQLYKLCFLEKIKESEFKKLKTLEV